LSCPPNITPWTLLPPFSKCFFSLVTVEYVCLLPPSQIDFLSSFAGPLFYSPSLHGNLFLPPFSVYFFFEPPLYFKGSFLLSWTKKILVIFFLFSVFSFPPLFPFIKLHPVLLISVLYFFFIKFVAPLSIPWLVAGKRDSFL